MAETKQIQGNLSSPATQQDVGLLVDDLGKQISPLQAYDLLQELQQSVSYAQLDEAAAQFYRRQLTLLKFAAFSFLKGDEQVRLLQNSIVSALKAGVDVRGNIEHIFLPDFLGRVHEQKVHELTQGLESSSGKLGTNPIRVGGEVSPDVKNWLLDFKNFSGGKSSAYEIVNYLTNSQNAKNLNEQDSAALRDLLVLYRFLKFDAIPKDYLEPASPESGQGRPAPLKEDQTIATTKNASRGEREGFTRQQPAPKVAPSPKHMVLPKPTLAPKTDFFTAKTEEHVKKVQHAEPSSKPKPAARPEREKFTQDKIEQYNRPSEEAVANIEKIAAEGIDDVPASLSGSLVSSGSETDGNNERGMRPGTQVKSPSANAEEKTLPRPTIKSQGPEARGLSSDAHKTLDKIAQTETKPNRGTSEELLKVLQKAGTAPAPVEKPAVQASKEIIENDHAHGESGIVDLKKNSPSDLNELNEPLQLARVKLTDLRSAGFELGLNIIKQKVTSLAQKHELPARQVAGYFFRSPAYSIYTNTIVAITNDANRDQRAAFEKLNKQLEASGKEHLSREEFLSFHRFKKELSS